jgi:hypothetical protein
MRRCGWRRLRAGRDIGQGADAAGGFDAAARAGYAAEQGHVGSGCAAGGEAGGGLQEIRAGLDGDFGGAKLFFHREQAGFQNHLEQRAVMMGDGGRRVDGVVDGVVVAALELADGDDHVQFADAETGEGGCLLAQRGDERSAERKADDDADRNARAGEQA